MQLYVQLELYTVVEWSSVWPVPGVCQASHPVGIASACGGCYCHDHRHWCWSPCRSSNGGDAGAAELRRTAHEADWAGFSHQQQQHQVVVRVTAPLLTAAVVTAEATTHYYFLPSLPLTVSQKSRCSSRSRCCTFPVVGLTVVAFPSLLYLPILVAAGKCMLSELGCAASNTEITMPCTACLS